MMRGIFTSQSNGKIRVGGEEAMEPNLESLGERGGGATQAISYNICILIIMMWRLRWIEEDIDVDGGVSGRR